jgi:hypothetical protein
MMTDHRQDEPSGSTGSAESPTESHVDRAMLGPTPDNPSLSLKKRLKRAAFFDKRDREVAAGEAAPVDADAGLPDQMVEDIAELEDHAADRS